MFAIIVSMSIFAFIGAVSPGPVNIIATSSSANFGFVRTLPHVFGAALSYAIIVFLMGTGLMQTLLKYPQLTQSIKYLGAVFLLYMAYKIASAAVTNDEMLVQKGSAPSILQGCLVQWLNPKAWLVSMSGISIFVTPHTPTNFYLLLFTVLSFVICFLGVGIWAFAGVFINKYLKKAEYQRLFNYMMGGFLGLAVIAMLY